MDISFSYVKKQNKSIWLNLALIQMSENLSQYSRNFNVNVLRAIPQLNVLNFLILSIEIKNPNHFYEFLRFV